MSIRIVQNEDLRHLVDDDRLAVQCTGASIFLSKVLNHAFGKVCARPIHGNAVQPNGTISSVGHAQTLFALDGKRYILDATPASSHTATGGVVRPKVLSGTRTTIPETSTNPSDSLEGTLEEITEEFTTQKSLSPLNSVIKQQVKDVRTIFGCNSDEKLYELCQSKPEHDPLRRTIQALVRRKHGADVSEVFAAIAYIERLKTLDVPTKRKLHVETYSSGMLDFFVRKLTAIAEHQGES